MVQLNIGNCPETCYIHRRYESEADQTNRAPDQFYLCHNIAAFAPPPPWVENAMFSNALSVSKSSRNAANGRKGTASPGCARPKPTSEISAEFRMKGAE